MVEVMRLEAFPVVDGTHVVATGSSVSGTTACRFVIDMSFDANNSPFVIDARHNEAGIDYFDDVAVLDDYVATIDHKHQSEGHYLRLFDKPATIGASIFTTLTYQTIHHYSSCDYLPQSAFLVTALGGNDFATVCYAQSGRVYGDMISIYRQTAAGVPTLQYRGYVDLGAALGSSWELKEFVYDASDNALYLLQRLDSVVSRGSNGTLTKIDLSMLPYQATGYYTSLMRSMSADDCSSTPYNVLASGSLPSGELALLAHSDLTGPCEASHPMTIKPIGAQDFEFDRDLVSLSYRFSAFSSTPIITPQIITINCN